MRLFQKYAAALAVLSALACALAAPYLVPINPDSPVYRSAALPLLLLLACTAPAREALRRADRRTLVCALAFGLLLALCLSLGAELTVYERLLPGRGSLLRRLAVPLLATPLLGLLAARLMDLRLGTGDKKALPALAWGGLLLLLWLPVLLAYWPGMLGYDFAGEYAQRWQGYANLHPLLHSALQNGIIALGERLHSPNLGLLMMTVLQMSLFALALGRACRLAARLGGRGAGLALLLLFGLHPIFSTLACSMTKDTLYAAALLTLCLDMAYLLCGGRMTRGLSVRFVLCVVAVCGMRTNGFVALLALPFFLLVLPRKRRALVLCLAGLAAAGATQGMLTLVLRPAAFPSFQFFSLPAQQLVRARAAGTLSPEQAQALEGWYTDPAGLAVHPHLADPAKGYLDRTRLQTSGADFLALWRDAAKSSALPYAEAFLLLNIGSWYPDDKSHATLYPDVSWNDKGYLQTQELDVPGFKTRCLLPAVRELMERVCRRNAHQKLPVLSLLAAPGTPLLLLVFALFALLSRGRGRLAPALLAPLLLWASYLLGPGAVPRYALPLFCLAPLALVFALSREPWDAEEG